MGGGRPAPAFMTPLGRRSTPASRRPAWRIPPDTDLTEARRANAVGNDVVRPRAVVWVVRVMDKNIGAHLANMNLFSHIPPGFRFHPTEEELVDYYLRKKISSRMIDIDIVIQDIDLYKIEPWDLPEICKINAEEQSEWYFFSHKDKKYPSGTRTNRATTAGFWKATGRDKPIYSKEENLEEGWVVCRVFKKRIASTQIQNVGHGWSPSSSHNWFEENLSFTTPQPNNSPKNTTAHDQQFPAEIAEHHPFINFKSELQQQYHSCFLHLPPLESPTPPHLAARDHTVVTDWRVFDKLVASQLCHADASKDSFLCNYTGADQGFQISDEQTARVPECASTSTSSEHIN
ncbi:NAC domain-containing protein 7 [Platanthera guangdongensis]|uniref:NAC domain-containing protein 7 n=1 Tax=Platanthera guangdongensis TaxID=2320717 RepID=A0ABR2MN17_9ASPA